MEFTNRNITDRKKLFRRVGRLALPVFGFLLFSYLTSEDILGDESFAFLELSLNELITLTLLLLFCSAGVATYTKLILKLSIHDATLNVVYIDRYRLQAKTVSVPLSQVQISKYIYEDHDNFNDTHQEYYSVYLMHRKFGTLAITSIDFIEVQTITGYFDTMKTETAARMRKTRLLKKRTGRKFRV